MRNSINYLLILIFFLSITNCTSEESKPKSKYKQLNVSILLDLSDRIDPHLHPDQISRDKYIIKKVLEIVKNNVKRKGTFNSFDKFRIMFYPQPSNSMLFELAANLNFDLEKLQPREKKLLFKNIETQIDKNLDLLYGSATKTKTYHGADIWRFFKDEVDDKCLINKPNYKNFLIILTDGYIYWKYTKNQKGNRFTYISPNSNQIKKFRNLTNWEKVFNKGDYGLIKINKKYPNLRVLVAEINPIKNFPQDYDIIKKYLTKWFLEMGIINENIKILKTDLPTYTNPVIEKFFERTSRN